MSAYDEMDDSIEAIMERTAELRRLRHQREWAESRPSRRGEPLDRSPLAAVVDLASRRG